MTWRDLIAVVTPIHSTAIDNGNFVVVEKPTGLVQSKLDTPEIVKQKLEKADSYRQKRCYSTSHCNRDANPLEYGTQTLFVNASIEGTEENPIQLPWMVDLELPCANVLKCESVKVSSQTDTTEFQAAKTKTSTMKRHEDREYQERRTGAIFEDGQKMETLPNTYTYLIALKTLHTVIAGIT